MLPDPCAELLRQYYQVTDDDNRQLELLEGRMVLLLRKYIMNRLQWHGIQGEELNDLAAQVYIRWLSGLRYSRAGNNVRSLFAWTSAVVHREVIQERRKGTPPRRMTQIVHAIVKRSHQHHLFGRWELTALWLIGLAEWHGQPCRDTERYLDFCEDDTRFFQERLPDGTTGVPPWKLMFDFFSWIQTPLEEKRLIAHMIDLTGMVRWEEVPIEDIVEPVAPDTDTVLFSGEAWWKEICKLPLRARTVLLLGCEREAITLLTCQIGASAALAEALNLPLEETRKLWPRLPLADEEIAQRLGATAENVRTHRYRSRQTLRTKNRDLL